MLTSEVVDARDDVVSVVTIRLLSDITFISEKEVAVLSRGFRVNSVVGGLILRECCPCFLFNRLDCCISLDGEVVGGASVSVGVGGMFEATVRPTSFLSNDVSVGEELNELEMTGTLDVAYSGFTVN